MYLELAESYLSARRSKAERKKRRESRREEVRENVQERRAKMRERLKRAFYIPVRKNGRIIHVREDLFDNIPEQEFEQVMSEAEYLEENYLSEGEYLADKESRAAKRAARQERRERRQEAKTQRKEIKTEKAAAKTDVVRARAELKRGKAAAKARGEKSNWLDDVTGVASAVGDVVGAFTGGGSGGGAVEEPQFDERTGELTTTAGPIAAELGAKSKKGWIMPVAIGGGALLLVGVLAFALKGKKGSTRK
jgi:hypothetical protein